MLEGFFKARSGRFSFVEHCAIRVCSSHSVMWVVLLKKEGGKEYEDYFLI